MSTSLELHGGVAVAVAYDIDPSMANMLYLDVLHHCETKLNSLLLLSCGIGFKQ